MNFLPPEPVGDDDAAIPRPAVPFRDSAPSQDREPGEITALLTAVRDADGDADAAWNRIYALLYRDLRRIARVHLHRHPGHAGSATSLIGRAWLRLAGAQAGARNRAHLTSLIARAMRHAVLDEMRRALTARRGGGEAERREADGAATDRPLLELIALDQALDALDALDARAARVVALRYFGGLEETAIAELERITVRTVRRDWRRARAFLLCQLGEDRSTAL